MIFTFKNGKVFIALLSLLTIIEFKETGKETDLHTGHIIERRGDFKWKKGDFGSQLSESILNRQMHPLYKTTHLALVNNP